jgi:hypothetical protein
MINLQKAKIDGCDRDKIIASLERVVPRPKADDWKGIMDHLRVVRWWFVLCKHPEEEWEWIITKLEADEWEEFWGRYPPRPADEG